MKVNSLLDMLISLMAVWLMANITSLSIENDLHDQGVSVVSGLDEVGRGALAGPVAASIVAFSRDVEKEKLDKDSTTGDDGIINGQGYVVTDRNSLLEKLKGIDKDK